MEFKKKPAGIDKNHENELKKKFGTNFQAEKPKYFKEIVKWILLIVVALFTALLLRAYVFEWVVVQGQSMENTLYNNEVLFVSKLNYDRPKRGDIVIIQIYEGNWDYLAFFKDIPLFRTLFPSQGEVNYIKRVVGLPGDEIDIRDGYLYINGEKQQEPYTKGLTYEQSFELPRVVPENKVFVMGDNREYSKDSRQLGFIGFERIKGKAIFRVKPLKSFGSIY
ncbi:MAG TPA: signal peptidase I [Hungateiclostridium thermocellum]|jgi:signal peptidase I|uniref:Signal peptidase I n=2 Tax=Acetivibrio thermocellus TaxID=1515 RepID=A3DDH0_ACET2|nr:signal peptidase I [Acetivibrio thermocellus]CDG35459.1 signal peptidase I [Acetivibrio thermocellus BC1]ABN51999.1 signal peptidase I [Acetivibrio thermocellus ATCC 27405]ADU74520.1 signal peptidase I [Acetivibrio thermocellus DSM 1313]ALX08463.1 signal peptidase I [Acetivibrio thermocellus AD2]ANV76212.1 signal peptidase I [Acetivibrio thermocellus DSM 2360]